MKRETINELRITEEEVRLIMANRKKKRIKYMKRMKRKRRISHFKKTVVNKLYPIPQRLGGVGLAVTGIIVYRMAASAQDGEVAFAGFFMMLSGMAVAFAQKSIYNM